MTAILAVTLAQLADLATYSLVIGNPNGYEAGALGAVSPQQAVIVKAAAIVVMLLILAALRPRWRRWGALLAVVVGCVGATSNLWVLA
jgi:hypothetical protein